MQLFPAALPGEIHQVIAQKDLAEITLDDIYKSATTIQREIGSKTVKTIVSVEEERLRRG